MYYSASTNGFYDPSIHGDAIPSDTVEITAEQYAALLSSQSSGGVIKADSNGRPVAVMPSPPTLDQVKATLCVSIDDAADAAYAAIGGLSPGRLAEYAQAKADALAYQAAGYNGVVPATVQCAATAANITPEAAAQSILQTAASWENALVAIRSARLLGKAAVTQATDDASARAAASEAISNIKAVAP